MATGVTRNNWTEDTHIINDESFTGKSEYELTYEDKVPENEVLNTPANANYEQIINGVNDNDLYFGDNLDVMRYLLHEKNLRGKIKLVYIDPPYGTSSVFQSRHQKNAYKDDLVGSHFIEFMRRRLICLRELLDKTGSIYVHLDGNMIFQIKVIMDEVFGARNFRGFITRKKCSNKNYTKKTYGNISDYIIFYSRSDNYTWHRATEVWSNDRILKEYPCIDEKTGRRYKKVPIHAPGTRNGETGKEWRGMMPPKGKHWQYIPAKLEEFDSKGEIYWSENGNPRRKVFLNEDQGIPVQDIWLDVQDSLNQNIKITGYPTEKNPSLLERIIKASTNVGDIVLDCFAGSGTTMGIAEQNDRKWIGIDNSSESIKSIFRRFYMGLEEMGDFVNKGKNGRNSDSISTGLFDDHQEYKVKQVERNNFNFYSDSRYSELVRELINDVISK